jgi:hypothetical protein
MAGKVKEPGLFMFVGTAMRKQHHYASLTHAPFVKDVLPRAHMLIGNNSYPQDPTSVLATKRAQSLLMRFVWWCFFSFVGRSEAQRCLKRRSFARPY